MVKKSWLLNDKFMCKLQPLINAEQSHKAINKIIKKLKLLILQIYKSEEELINNDF